MILSLPSEKLNFSFDLGRTHVSINQLSFGTYRCSIGKHSHAKDYYELHLLTGGEGEVVVPLGGYPLAKGTLYMTGSCLEHEQINNEDFPMQEYCVGFEAKRRNGKEESSWLDAFLQIQFALGEDRGQTCLHHFEQIETELMAKKLGYLEMIQNHLVAIFVEFLRQTSTENQEKDAPGPRLEKRSYIIDNSLLFECATLTEKELARTLNLSVRQLQRYLKTTYNQSFMQLRTKARLTKARELLAKGNSYAQVAEEVGFDHANYLKRLLKLHPTKEG